MTRRSLPLLLVAALALGAGAIKAWESGSFSPLSASLVSAGLICLGAWIGQEVASSLNKPPPVEKEQS